MTPMKRQKNVDMRNFYKFPYFTELYQEQAECSACGDGMSLRCCSDERQ